MKYSTTPLNLLEDTQKQLIETGSMLIYLLANQGAQPLADKDYEKRKLIAGFRDSAQGLNSLFQEAEETMPLTLEEQAALRQYNEVGNILEQGATRIESQLPPEQISKEREQVLKTAMQKIDDFTREYRERARIRSLAQGLETLRSDRERINGTYTF